MRDYTILRLRFCPVKIKPDGFSPGRLFVPRCFVPYAANTFSHSRSPVGVFVRLVFVTTVCGITITPRWKSPVALQCVRTVHSVCHSPASKNSVFATTLRSTLCVRDLRLCLILVCTESQIYSRRNIRDLRRLCLLEAQDGPRPNY